MILLDFSQIVISGILANLGKDARRDNPNAKSLIKHMVLTSLLTYSKKYTETYGELVLAVDSKHYWRKDVFPNYKGNRKKMREKSHIDWDFVYEVINEVKDDLRENFRYKMIEVQCAEADDVVACIVKYLQTNELEQTGLFHDSPQDVLIVSADGDFVQLQEYQNVRQWSPILKKFVTPKMSIKEYKIIHICTAGDDSIPNICSPDDVFMRDDLRQTPFKKARLEEFFEKGIDACKNDMERRNFQRNKTLIDFDCIPDDIYQKIIDEYTSYKIKGNKTKVYNYLVKNRMKLLLEDAGKF